MWDCVLVDVQACSKIKDNYKYLLTVIDVFPKFLHNDPLKSKTGTNVRSAFKSILKNTKYSTPKQGLQIWVRTDKGKDF